MASDRVPSKYSSLGLTGGETGTADALLAIVAFVVNALAPLGVKRLNMPPTGERTCQAIR